MSVNSSRTNFYVDALNFYYGVAQPYGIEWIDMEKLLIWVKEQPNIKKVTIQKQTDVNLSCKITGDARDEKEKGSYDICCLVSNNSNFAYPLADKQQLGQRILLITPKTENSRHNTSADLKKHISPKDIISQVNKKLVESCQLPHEVGEFTKPSEWA